MGDDGYTCQRCRQPLLLDTSLANVTQNQYDVIAGSLPAPDPPSTLSAEDKLLHVPTSSASRRAYRQAIAAATNGSTNPQESFILLSDSQIIPPNRTRNATNGIIGTTLTTKPTETPSTSPPTTSHSLSTRLISLVSSHTPIDHPLCTECAQVLQDALQGKLEEVQRERDAYLGFERKWAARVAETEGKRSADVGERKSMLKGKGRASVSGDQVGVPMLDEEFEKLRVQKGVLDREEKDLMEKLRTVETEQEELNREEEELKREEQELEQDEIGFLHHHDSLQAQIRDLEAELRTERTLHLIATQTLNRLETTNVYNDVFQIGHVPLVISSRGVEGSPSDLRRRTSGPAPGSSGSTAGMITPGTAQTVGTINGLRLGGRPWVDWPEINAAFGLVALCVDRIAAKVGCTFETYKIVPFGSFSRIDELPPSKNSYELYASSDITPARLLQNRRFNYALVGLLDCLRQLIAYGKVNRRGWEGGGLDIHKDKIGDYSIRLSFGMGMSSIGLGTGGTGSKEEESWTRALRAVLAVLKRVLVIESEADRENGG